MSAPIPDDADRYGDPHFVHSMATDIAIAAILKVLETKHPGILDEIRAALGSKPNQDVAGFAVS